MYRGVSIAILGGGVYIIRDVDGGRPDGIHDFRKNLRGHIRAEGLVDCRHQLIVGLIFRFDTLPAEFADMESSAFKRELGDIRSVLSDIHGAMYKTLDKDRNDKPSKIKAQAR